MKCEPTIDHCMSLRYHVLTCHCVQYLYNNCMNPFLLIVMSQNCTHACMQEVECGHRDVCEALSERLQMLQDVWRLWREGRGLQAATNCVRGCFSDDVYDTALFCDLLRSFSSLQLVLFCGPDSYFPLGLCRSPWTLAIAVVLLPVIVQLRSSLREPAQLQVLVGVVDMVVQRFSPSILACKSEEHNVFTFFLFL